MENCHGSEPFAHNRADYRQDGMEVTQLYRSLEYAPVAPILSRRLSERGFLPALLDGSRYPITSGMSSDMCKGKTFIECALVQRNKVGIHVQTYIVGFVSSE